MTTESAVETSAAINLRAENRNVAEAERILLQIARTSVNEANKEAYSKFSCLSTEDRRSLLESVYIFDNCPSSVDLQNHLEDALWGFCNRNQVANYLQYLEGWWFKRIVEGLNRSKFSPILGTEFDAQLSLLREQFKEDSLPIHVDIEEAIPDVEPFTNWMFSKQLHLIKISSNRLATAARYFYKASEQRSRWVREDLLISDELEKYDSTLKEEWSLLFEQVKDEIIDSKNEDELISLGKKVYEWAERTANFPIRKSYMDPFITRGSYHILANQLQVGWHPFFNDKLLEQSGEKQC